ncbi:MAG: LysR family transcriptional regulator [Thiohalophilus sp.]|uniref:LysR family transcriptional regulator n=1 Tax=Thiohalophilus sp. TaxID=3028392 RepID=UPI00287091C3|nr:LysR family transcriptional regulator [Thiohalophilus sp.]MDR9437412.1 LysR family transcriptional regulator [Thiohalophilus sp.]
MHVTLRQLKVFEAVARHLNYTQAAQELHLTQPAVSMQIKQLEESVGLPLFEQMGKQTYLTEAGREMYHYCRSISRQLNEAEEVIEQLKGVRRGHLDISVASTANYFATRLLASFIDHYAEVSFSLDVTNRATLLRQLEQNDKDLVIMGKPPEDRGLETEAFMENPLVVIAPPEHPLAAEAGIPLKRLEEEPFVVREPGSGTFIAMERFFSGHGVRLKTGMQMTSNEAIKQAVEAGLGLGIVSIHTLELELETGRLVVLDMADFPILRHWYVVHRQGKRLSPVAQAFKEFVLSRASKMVSRAHLQSA